MDKMVAAELSAVHWLSYATIVIAIACFGSFVKSFSLDNVTSIREIIKQLVTGVWIGCLLATIGWYRDLERITVILSAFIVGLFNVNFIKLIVRKLAGFFVDVATIFEEEVSHEEKKKPKKRIRKK